MQVSILSEVNEFINLTKRILKRNLPSEETTQANFRLIVKGYNSLIARCEAIIGIDENTPEAHLALGILGRLGEN